MTKYLISFPAEAMVVTGDELAAAAVDAPVRVDGGSGTRPLKWYSDAEIRRAIRIALDLTGTPDDGSLVAATAHVLGKRLTQPFRTRVAPLVAELRPTATRRWNGSA